MIDGDEAREWLPNLLIENDGIGIKRSNFWSSEMARRGSYYLSWHEGAARILIPNCDRDRMKIYESAKPDRAVFEEVEDKRLYDDVLEFRLIADCSVSHEIRFDLVGIDPRFFEQDHRGKSVPVVLWSEAGEHSRYEAEYRRIDALTEPDPGN